MYTEEKKNRNYGSIFVYCFFCFAFVVEVARLAKPYYNLKNLLEIETVVEEGFSGAVVNSGNLPCTSTPAHDQKGLSQIITSEFRDIAPYSYCVKFQSYVTMVNLIRQNGGGKYESRPFSAGGYNWTFLIYPNANIPAGSGAFVSLYVKIDNSSFINNPHDVYAEMTFVVYKTLIDKYQITQETLAQRFHYFKQEWGRSNFIYIMYVEDASHGFQTSEGSIVFGVDIKVFKPFPSLETISYEQNIPDPIFDWKITNFSTRYLDSYTSDTFTSGGRSWVLKAYPNGVGSGAGNWLSLFLVSTTNENTYMAAKLRVIDQNLSNHFEKQVAGWPNSTVSGWGFEQFISFADIRNASKGFVVDDTIKFQVHISSFFKTEVISR